MGVGVDLDFESLLTKKYSFTILFHQCVYNTLEKIEIILINIV